MKLMERRLFRNQPMEQVMLRLPPNVRDKAKQFAKEQSDERQSFTESDVYRTAVLRFLESVFTDSKDEKGENQPK